jgi:hypothetical protein
MTTTTVLADDGIFIPRKLLPVGGEWTLMVLGNEVILRPKLDRATSHRRARERREKLKAKFGLFSDSTDLIREDRDSR